MLNKIIQFLRSFQMCNKEDAGYRCRHGIHNGIRECDGKRV